MFLINYGCANKMKKFTLSIYSKRLVITYKMVTKFNNSKSIIKKLLYVTFILPLICKSHIVKDL